MYDYEEVIEDWVRHWHGLRGSADRVLAQKARREEDAAYYVSQAGIDRATDAESLAHTMRAAMGPLYQESGKLLPICDQSAVAYLNAILVTTYHAVRRLARRERRLARQRDNARRPARRPDPHGVAP